MRSSTVSDADMDAGNSNNSSGQQGGYPNDLGHQGGSDNYSDSSGQQAGYEDVSEQGNYEDVSGLQGNYSDASVQQDNYNDNYAQQGNYDSNHGQQGNYGDTSGQQGYEDVSDQQGGYDDVSGQRNGYMNGSGVMSNANASGQGGNEYSDANSNAGNNSGNSGRQGMQAQGHGFGQGFDQGFHQGLSGDPGGAQPHEGVHVQEGVGPDSASRDTDMVSPAKFLHCSQPHSCNFLLVSMCVSMCKHVLQVCAGACSSASRKIAYCSCDCDNRSVCILVLDCAIICFGQYLCGCCTQCVAVPAAYNWRQPGWRL